MRNFYSSIAHTLRRKRSSLIFSCEDSDSWNIRKLDNFSEHAEIILIIGSWTPNITLTGMPCEIPKVTQL